MFNSLGKTTVIHTSLDSGIISMKSIWTHAAHGAYLSENQPNTEENNTDGCRDKAVVILFEPLDPFMTEARDSPLVSQ